MSCLKNILTSGAEFQPRFSTYLFLIKSRPCHDPVQYVLRLYLIGNARVITEMSVSMLRHSVQCKNQSHYRPGVAQGVPRNLGSQIT